MENDSDEVTNKLGALKGAPVLLPDKRPSPVKEVGVREPRRAEPLETEAEVSKPPPVVPQVLADLVTTVIEGIGEVPGRATFDASDFEFLQKEAGLVRFKAAKGLARQSVGLQSAEEAVSRVTRAESQITSEKVQRHQDPSQIGAPGFPYGLFAVPLIYEILKLIDLRAGAAHLPPPLRAVSSELLQGKQLPDRNLAREFAGTKGADPRAKDFAKGTGGTKTGPAGGGKSIDARGLLQGQIIKAKRKLVPFRRADPNL